MVFITFLTMMNHRYYERSICYYWYNNYARTSVKRNKKNRFDAAILL